MSLISTEEKDQPVDFHPEFNRETLCHSDTAQKACLPNECPEEFLDNLSRLSHLLAAIKTLLNNKPIKINSGFRCVELNRLVGGVENSQHCLGLAADIVCPSFGSARELAQKIAKSTLEFDQLILEFDRWVHISIHPRDELPRKEILTLSKEWGYQEGISE